MEEDHGREHLKKLVQLDVHKFMVAARSAERAG